MAVEVRTGGSAQGSVSGASTLSLTVPSSVVAGDIMVLNYHVNVTGYTSCSASSGGGAWTQIGSRVAQGTGVVSFRFYRVATVEAPGSTLTITPSGTTGGGHNAQMLTLLGHDPNTPINVESAAGFAAGSTVSYAGLTPTVNDAMLLAFASCSGEIEATDLNAPSGMTEGPESFVGTTDGNHRVGHVCWQLLSGGADQAIAAKTSTPNAGTTIYGVGGMIAVAPGIADTIPPAAPTGLTATVTTE